MTKKKRNHPDLEEVLARPWCYYCERDFDDLKILINHQKAKHFKCERCGRRLNTAGGLSVHMSQVHKENLTAVDNALPNRVGLDIEIFGMEGIPEDIIQQHNQRVLTTYHQAQADRQASSSNGAAGTGAGATTASKKMKLETTSDLKKRLAEHKAAKLAAEQSNGGSSGDATPVGAGHGQVQPQSNLSTPTSVFPQIAQQTQQHTAPSATNTYPSHSPYGQAVSPPQPTYGLGVHQQPQMGYNQPTQPQFPPGQLYGQHSQPSFPQQPPVLYPPQSTFSPPPYQNHPPYPGPQYPQNGTGMYPGHPGGPPRPFGAGSPPPPPFPPQHQANHIYQGHSPQPTGNFPAPIRTGSVSLPNAPGLPQRPVFAAPPVNAFQFQQMHQGQIPSAPNFGTQQPGSKQDAAPGTHIPPMQNQLQNGTSPQRIEDAPNAASIDDLISSASQKADADAVAVQAARTSTPSQPNSNPASSVPNQAPPTAKEDVTDDKAAAKKEKDKPKTARLVYSDNETSPEEKMALLPRYAFTPEQKTIMV